MSISKTLINVNIAKTKSLKQKHFIIAVLYLQSQNIEFAHDKKPVLQQNSLNYLKDNFATAKNVPAECGEKHFYPKRDCEKRNNSPLTMPPHEKKVPSMGKNLP